MTIERPRWWRYSLQYARAGFESKVLKRKPIFLHGFCHLRCGLNCGHCFYREELLNGNIHSEKKLWEYDRFTQNCASFPKTYFDGWRTIFAFRSCRYRSTYFIITSQASRQITIPTAGQHPDAIESLVVRRPLTELS